MPPTPTPTPTAPATGAPVGLAGLAAGLVAGLADLVLPRVCAGCGRPGAVLCPGCGALLARPRLAQPRRHPAGFPPTVAAGDYAGAVRPVVNAFKERDRAELAGPLGTALALAVTAVLAGSGGTGAPVLLVPVPSSAAARRERGRDHVAELTVRAVGELRAAGLDVRRAPLLARRGRVRDSAGLSADQRRTNLAGSFVRSRHRLPPPDTLLVVVDDVVTSGATLTEVAGVLGRCCGSTVLGAVVAATPRGRRRPTPDGPGVITIRER